MYEGNKMTHTDYLSEVSACVMEYIQFSDDMCTQNSEGVNSEIKPMPKLECSAKCQEFQICAIQHNPVTSKCLFHEQFHTG